MTLQWDFPPRESTEFWTLLKSVQLKTWNSCRISAMKYSSTWKNCQDPLSTGRPSGQSTKCTSPLWFMLPPEQKRVCSFIHYYFIDDDCLLLLSFLIIFKYCSQVRFMLISITTRVTNCTLSGFRSLMWLKGMAVWPCGNKPADFRLTQSTLSLTVCPQGRSLVACLLLLLFVIVVYNGVYFNDAGDIGSLFVFDGRIHHRSDANTTDEVRTVLTFALKRKGFVLHVL